MCKLTIGLPVYNAERFLKDCIQSILNQTYKDSKLLIIDDGSTDGSIKIIQSFSDPRIEFYQDGENKGLPYRLNQIAKLCKTKYLARMDADDIMHPKRLEYQIELLKKNPSIDVLGSNAYVIDEFNQINGIRYNNNIKSELLSVSSFIHPTIIAKTEWFQKNPYDENMIRIEDLELWQRTRHFSNFKTIPEPLLFYREFGDGYYRKYYKSLPGLFALVTANLFSNTSFALNIFFKNFLKTFFVFLAYYFAFLLNFESRLLATRNCKIIENEKKEAYRILSIAVKKDSISI